MPDLRYDTEALRDSARRYREAAQKMNTVKSELEKSISSLKAVHWQSDAGNAFMELYEEEWAQAVNKYVAVMYEMASQLDYAAGRYDDVTKVMNQIGTL